MGGEWRSFLGALIWALNPYFILVAVNSFISSDGDRAGITKHLLVGPGGIWIGRLMKSFPLGLAIGAALGLIGIHFLRVVANEAGSLSPISLSFGGYIWLTSIAMLGISVHFSK